MRRFLLFLLFAAAIVLCAGRSRATPLAAQVPSSVTLCAGINYSGFCEDVTYDWPYITYLGVLNGASALFKNISSVRLNGTGVVALYDQAAWAGNCVTLQQSVPDLRDASYNFNDKTQSMRMGIACSQTGAPSLTLYADQDRNGTRTIMTSSVPDLRAAPYNFNDTASSIGITTGTVWAVYSDINYGGSCETVTENIPWLGATGVGNDSVSSVKENSTCAGPVANSYVSDVTVVTGNSRNIPCPGGFTKKWQDLNQGVGGAFVFACVKYTADPNSALQEVYTAVTTQCNGSDEVVNADLNSGAKDGLGVSFPIFFCKHRQNTNGGSGSTQGANGLFNQYFSTGTKMRDLLFYMTPTMPSCIVSCGGIGADAAGYLEFAVNIQPLCQSVLSSSWVPAFHYYQGSTSDKASRVPADAADMNLNSGMTSFEHPNFTWIYPCVREGDAVTGTDTNAPDTTPPTISPVAVLVPTATGCVVFCQLQTVTPSGIVTKAGAVTVAWNCTDSQDPKPTGTSKQTFSTATNRSYTLQGICTDASGNKAVATFSFTISVP
jgi:hypothetical protein